MLILYEGLLFAVGQDALDEFEAYCERRAAGSGPELVQSRDEALDWLRWRAPLNQVDGAWLSHVHRVTTPFALRSVTSSAWQTLPEELGDGILDEQHIFIFRQQLRDIGIRLPDTHDADFLDARHGMEREQMWRSTTGQHIVSLFPNDFLPEILGFNLHFESLALSDLKATKEHPYVPRELISGV